MSPLATMAAALVTGLLLGAALAAAYAASAGSFFQERLQRKVRHWEDETASARKAAEELEREVLYWQAETARAKEAAERLADRLQAQDTWPKSPTGREWK